MGRYFARAPLVLGFWRRVRLRSGGGQDNDRLVTPSEEVEDEKEDPKAEPLIETPAQAPRQLARIQLDTLVGMGISNIIALFIHDNAQFAFLSEVWIWKPSHEIPIAAVAVSAMRPDALGR
jgi:hypothetical protein